MAQLLDLEWPELQDFLTQQGLIISSISPQISRIIRDITFDSSVLKFRNQKTCKILYYYATCYQGELCMKYEIGVFNIFTVKGKCKSVQEFSWTHLSTDLL